MRILTASAPAKVLISFTNGSGHVSYKSDITTKEARGLALELLRQADHAEELPPAWKYEVLAFTTKDEPTRAHRTISVEVCSQ